MIFCAQWSENLPIYGTAQFPSTNYNLHFCSVNRLHELGTWDPSWSFLLWSSTSIKPSTLPVTRYCPSGEKRAHLTCDFCPNLICFDSCVGYFSSSWSLMAALPRNKSIVVPVTYICTFECICLCPFTTVLYESQPLRKDNDTCNRENQYL